MIILPMNLKNYLIQQNTNMITNIFIILIIAIIGLLIVFLVALFRKKKIKGYIKIPRIFEGSFEAEE